MRRLMVFNQVTLDGYFTDRHGDMSWAHKSDPEWDAFVESNASPGGALLFGRVTYEMMAGYWPSPAAAKDSPLVAKQMNELPKIVLSSSLKEAKWNNTRIVRSLADIEAIKHEPGPDMVILGSGSVVSQLAGAGLIDEYQIVVNPIALGAGRTLFDGLRKKVELKLMNTRAFRNGNVVLTYEPL